MEQQHHHSEEYHEKNERIWFMFLPPFVWAVHLLACYLTAAIWCAKFSGMTNHFLTVRVAIGIYTLLALAIIGSLGWTGYRRHRHLSEDLAYHDDTPLDRYRFLGLATFLLSALSAVATLFVAAVALFFGNCN
ncbi:hypothetical protein [Gimesia maris]|uniref:hypothetical protein n=1 Tax=Gimesia maris TaxID=122 RepID=UPI00241DDAE1|nr:hypothetical protein [Gimesia maris]